MRKAVTDLFTITGATFSPCRTWRYRLWRIWDSSKPSVLFVMLNPSTADETRNDPTVERCQRYTSQWGYGGLTVCNLFAYRATNPVELSVTEDPIGPENDQHIRDAAILAGLIVCAWGEHGSLGHRDQEIIALLRQSGASLHCLRLTKRGLPGHPLYLPKTLKPMPLEPK